MTINAGVWIDHHRAVLVILKDHEESQQEISADDFPAMANHGAPHAQVSYTRNDFVPEDRLERKETTRVHHFFDRVIDLLPDAESILVFGPGEAKGEFVKRLQAAHPRQPKIDVTTSDKLTSNQVAAFVREHFLTK